MRGKGSTQLYIIDSRSDFSSLTGRWSFGMPCRSREAAVQWTCALVRFVIIAASGQHGGTVRNATAVQGGAPLLRTSSSTAMRKGMYAQQTSSQ